MKNLILILIFVLPTAIFSQGHYIIPDIGAPDMAVYVEMIAPHDQKGYFGDDGFYLGEASDKVKIQVNKNAQYVTFGPLVVSWDGRMISTHIFIDETANPPITFPTTAYEVEFDVVGSSVPSPRSFIYNIVKPQSLGNNGDISGINETVLGQGTLGFRSDRGAMIVDSLSLKANTTYTISTNDPDGDLNNGNQGFFPAIILSKGPIKGNGSTIDASARSKHAGPGGGGGGGNFLDIAGGSGGSNGGDGFTSGGKGGTNTYSNSQGNYREFGNATGANGFSYNGIESFDPVPVGGWEASYGGTGHPFGTNGKQSTNGGSADDQGGYGGGSGWRNNTRGGAGGYNRAGGGDAVTGGTTGGKVHGNEMIVPFAGGSGGASGNPEAQFPLNLVVTSGDGGGGGGAINVFGTSIDDLDIIADGDDGRDGGRDSEGGPGSGGAATLMAKASMTNISLSADGGTRSGRSGGAGRIRYDGWEEFDDPPVNPASASNYRGISTDTAYTIRPRHRLTGTHTGGKQIKIYRKSATTNWTEINSISVGTPGWANTLIFDENHEDKYYLVAVQDEGQSMAGDFTYAPQYVLSQAATNILRFGEPDIYCPADTSYDFLSCGSGIYEDFVLVQSIGGEFLELQVTDNWVFGDRGFEVVEPFDGTVSPVSPDSLHYIKFRYTKLAGQSGTITDTLLVAHNAFNKDTCRIAVSINLQEFEVTILDETGTNEIDTLDLGTICVGETASKRFVLRNTSDLDLTDFDLRIETNGSVESTDFSVFPKQFSQLAIDESKIIDASFKDVDNNSFPSGVTGKVLIYSSQCPNPIDTLVLIVKVVSTELTISEADNSLDFGAVNTTSTSDMTVTVTNTGDSPALVQLPVNVDPAFTLVAPPAVDFPILLAPIADDPAAKLDITYRFSPTAEIDYLDSTNFISLQNQTNNSCNDTIKMYLTGEGTTSEITFKDTLDFGILYECQIDSVKDIFIKNESNVKVTIDTINAVLLGPEADYFNILAKPFTISANGQNNFLFGFIPPNVPATSGVKNARIEFDLLPPTGETKIIHLKAEIDTFQMDYSPKPFDMGLISVGFAAPSQPLTITNNGKLPRTVTGFTYEANTKLNITHTNGLPITIPAGSSEIFDVDISLAATDLGPFSEKVIANFELCDNELEIDVEATGVEGKLEIITEEDLGDFPPCYNVTKNIEFRNVGQADIRLDSVLILDNNVEISRVNLSPIIIEEYDGTNGLQNTYDISKTGLPFGKDSTIIKVYVFENGATQEYTKLITANIVSGITIIPNPVDFGTVFQNEMKSITVTIAKDPAVSFSSSSDFDIDIDIVNLNPNHLEYSFLPPNSFTLDNANPSQSFDIEFTASDAQNYNATLQVAIKLNGCPYSVPLELLANGSAGDSVKIFTKELNDIEPNIENFRIPIYGKLITQDKTQEKKINIQISKLEIDFEKTMFFPMELSNGTFLNRNTDGDLARLTIAMDNPVEINSSNEVILTELLGPTMLGNKKQTLIHMNARPTLTDETGISDVNALGNFMNMTVCQEGGDRLLEYTNGFDYTLEQTPINIIINANLVEQGTHTIMLMNSTGNSELIATVTRSKEDKNEYNISHNISHLSSGVYFIVFETPARFKTRKLIIIK